VRVYELAKELNLNNKELVTKIEKMGGIDIKNHMSGLSDAEVERIKNEFYPKKGETKKAPEVKVDEKELEEKRQKRKEMKIKEKHEKHEREEQKALEKEIEEEERAAQAAEDEIIMVRIPEMLSISELGCAMGTSATEIIKYLMLNKGVMATINQEIEYKLAAEIAEHFDVIVELQEQEDVLDETFSEDENEEKKVKRAPVVVVMGHVDHGKTSLLDAVRKTDVIASEAGGITQHIGASVIEHNGEKITFLDTPGHEAFTAMRLRGAKATDIAILVVAADDGVMPQTIEAISHAKAAEIPIIVAINKMDKPEANPDRVKQELTEHGLVCEEWGGEIICMPVSALKNQGINELLDTVLLVAEMEILKADPTIRAKGTVIESKLEKGRGVVTSLLINAGHLRIADPVISGTAYGKVRAMTDDRGNRITEAGPSTPVEILGLNEAPSAGEVFYVAEGEKQARKYAEHMSCIIREKLIKSTSTKVSLDDLFTHIKEGNMKTLNIIIKADVQGSAEAVKQSLEKLTNENILIKILHTSVGAISESDIMLASASNAIVIGFNVRADGLAQATASKEGVDIRYYRVIYNIIEDVTAAMTGMLDPEFEEKVTGHAEVRDTFKVSKVGTIGGCYVTDGFIKRDSSVRVLRDSVVVFEGELASLKRFKDDAKEVKTGFECGIMVDKFNDIKEGDVIEAYVMEEIKR